jgi:hypothetical protein
MTLLGLDGLMGDRGDARYFLYPFATVVFSAIGVIATLRDLGMRTAKRVVWFGFGFLLALFVVYSVYLFTDVAFLIPGAFIVFATAGFGVVAGNQWALDVWRNSDRERRSIIMAAGAIILDLLLAVSLISVINSRLNAHPVESTMVPALQDVDTKVPSNALVISNMSLQFLELYLPGRKFIALNTADPGEHFTDYHLHRLYEKRASGSKDPLPPVVFDGDSFTSSAMYSLVTANHANTPVYVLLCSPESEQYGAMIKTQFDELGSRFTLETVDMNSALALYKLTAKVGAPTRTKSGRKSASP